MTLQECYAALGGNYAEVLGRLRSERLVQKFVLRFPDDGSMALLESSLAGGDAEEAFRAAHTLKGTCQNLGFTRLGQSSHDLTEALRPRVLTAPDVAPLTDRVRADYAAVIAAITAFKASQAG